MSYSKLTKEELVSLLEERNKEIEKISKKRDEYKAGWEDAKKIIELVTDKKEKSETKFKESLDTCEKEKEVIAGKANQIFKDLDTLKNGVLDLDTVIENTNNVMNQLYVSNANMIKLVRSKYIERKGDE